jgi:Xaa-Pro aminopeptidase
MLRISPLGVLLVCAALAGCGGKSGESSVHSSRPASAGSATSAADAAAGTPANDGALSKHQYEQAFRRAFRTAKQSNLASKARGDDGEKQLVVAQASLARLVETLRAVKPPGEVAQAHRAVIASFAVFSSRMAKVIAANKAGDKAGAEKAMASMSAANMPPDVVARAKAAGATFKRLGYHLGPVKTP